MKYGNKPKKDINGIGFQSMNIFRLLIIEDDQERIKTFLEWIPKDIKIVWVKSAGRAIGLLKRDSGNVYAGILLDHDLQQQAATEIDKFLSGSNVIDIIIQNIDKKVPILIHSTNELKPPVMEKRLKNSGFKDVLRIPMHQLTKRKLNEWIEDIRELFEDN